MAYLTDFEIDFESSDSTYPFDGFNLNEYCPPKETRRKDIKKCVTGKDLKMIKDEVKKYMTKELKKAARADVGKLMSDIEELKEARQKMRSELTRLKKQVVNTKEDLKKFKKDLQKEKEAIIAGLQEERHDIEEMLERHGRRMLRHELIDV